MLSFSPVEKQMAVMSKVKATVWLLLKSNIMLFSEKQREREAGRLRWWCSECMDLLAGRQGTPLPVCREKC